MNVLRKLWNDEAGFVISSELVLVATLLVIGMIVGLVSLRNQVVQELTDLGAAIGMISQGYSYTGVEKINPSFVAQTDGSVWDDETDFCQTTDGMDVDNAEPGNIDVTAPGITAVSNTPTEL